MKWEKTGRSVKDGETRIEYSLAGTPYKVISHKRQVPHANGRGGWDYTDYTVTRGGEAVKVKNRLCDAKELAEDLWGSEKDPVKCSEVKPYDS